jgi:hypothetical protein
MRVPAGPERLENVFAFLLPAPIGRGPEVEQADDDNRTA